MVRRKVWRAVCAGEMHMRETHIIWRAAARGCGGDSGVEEVGVLVFLVERGQLVLRQRPRQAASVHMAVRLQAGEGEGKDE